MVSGGCGGELLKIPGWQGGAGGAQNRNIGFARLSD
jgi:hypothetical protein